MIKLTPKNGQIDQAKPRICVTFFAKDMQYGHFASEELVYSEMCVEKEDGTQFLITVSTPSHCGNLLCMSCVNNDGQCLNERLRKENDLAIQRLEETPPSREKCLGACDSSCTLV